MKRILKIIILSLLVCRLFSWPAFNQSADKSTPENADQIHFSIINSTSVTFDWAGSARYIWLGLNPNHLTKRVKASDSRFLPVTSPWKSAPGPYREAKVTRLKQNTTYYYSVGKGTVINKFKTPPPPGNSGFRICLTSAFRAIHYGILLLDFNDDTIEGRFICSENSTQPGPDYMPLEENICDHDGTIIDSFTIQN